MTESIDATPGSNARLVGSLALEALSGMHVHDLIVDHEYAGVRWTRGEQTGLSLLRFAGNLPIQSWSAARSEGSGPWPATGDAQDLIDLAASRAAANASDTLATLERYYEIRADQSRADELRDMFIEPMVVHGSGGSRSSSLDRFVEHVRNEPHETPGIRFQPHRTVAAVDRAFLLWSYTDGPAVLGVGLTLYALDGGRIVERWQAELPAGMGWD